MFGSFLPILTSLLLAGSVAHGVDANDSRSGPAETARQVHLRGDYPTSLHTHSEDGDTLVPLYGDEVLVAPARDLDDRPRHETGPVLPISLGGGAGVISYLVLVIAIVFMALFFLWLLFAGRARGPVMNGRGTKRPAAAVRRATDSQTGTDLPTDPDRLAEEGRFLDAVSALLERALSETGWKPVGKERSKTAREVLAKVPRDDRKRPLLERIVSVGEALRFGGMPADAETFGRMKSWVTELGAEGRSRA